MNKWLKKTSKKWRDKVILAMGGYIYEPHDIIERPLTANLCTETVLDSRLVETLDQGPLSDLCKASKEANAAALAKEMLKMAGAMKGDIYKRRGPYGDDVIVETRVEVVLDWEKKIFTLSPEGGIDGRYE